MKKYNWIELEKCAEYFLANCPMLELLGQRHTKLEAINSLIETIYLTTLSCQERNIPINELKNERK